MKHNPSIKTVEGLQVKAINRFPSMEWGPKGGMQCHIFYNNRKYCEVFQEGNGGEASEDYECDLTPEQITEFKSAVLTCLKRIDPSYGPDSEYSWLREKKVEDIDGDDLETLEIAVEERSEDISAAKKILNKGFKSAVIVDCDWQRHYLQGFFANEEVVKTWLAEYHPEIKYEKISIINLDNIDSFMIL